MPLERPLLLQLLAGRTSPEISGWSRGLTYESRASPRDFVLPKQLGERLRGGWRDRSARTSRSECRRGLKTASAPMIALPTLVSSSISAWTISSELVASAGGVLTRPGWRTAMRTVLPDRRSSATRWRPMKPVPPNTVIVPAMTYFLSIAQRSPTMHYRRRSVLFKEFRALCYCTNFILISYMSRCTRVEDQQHFSKLLHLIPPKDKPNPTLSSAPGRDRW